MQMVGITQNVYYRNYHVFLWFNIDSNGLHISDYIPHEQWLTILRIYTT